MVISRQHLVKHARLLWQAKRKLSSAFKTDNPRFSDERSIFFIAFFPSLLVNTKSESNIKPFLLSNSVSCVNSFYVHFLWCSKLNELYRATNPYNCSAYLVKIIDKKNSGWYFHRKFYHLVGSSYLIDIKRYNWLKCSVPRFWAYFLIICIKW